MILWSSVELSLLPSDRDLYNHTAAVAAMLIALTAKKTTVRPVVPQTILRIQHSEAIAHDRQRITLVLCTAHACYGTKYIDIRSTSEPRRGETRSSLKACNRNLVPTPFRDRMVRDCLPLTGGRVGKKSSRNTHSERVLRLPSQSYERSATIHFAIVSLLP